MLTNRAAALALLLAGLAGGPASAATCNLTVQGASVLDDAACAVVKGRRVTRLSTENGGIILIRGSVLSARLAELTRSGRRRHRPYTSFGQVVASQDSDDKICYFNQNAVLCVEH